MMNTRVEMNEEMMEQVNGGGARECLDTLEKVPTYVYEGAEEVFDFIVLKPAKKIAEWFF